MGRGGEARVVGEKIAHHGSRMAIFANRAAADQIRNAFYTLARRGDVLCIASPFFSNDALVREVADRGCDVRIVVRLGPSTDPAALRRSLRHERIQLRFFTSRRFHSNSTFAVMRRQKAA